MDARIDDLRAALAPWARRRSARDADADGSDGSVLAVAYERGLDRVLSGVRSATRVEWAVGIAAVFLLARGPLLFFRERFADPLGGSAGGLWQEDVALQAATGVIQIAVAAFAFRRADATALLRQPPLIVFVALAWVSVAWSVEPDVSMRRAGFLVGTIVVGWFIGDRFEVHQIVRIVAVVAMIGLAASIVAWVAAPDLAMDMGSIHRPWSGIYVNRNWLGMVLSLGLLASVFLVRPARRRALIAASAVLMAFILFLTGSKTGPAAFITAVIVTTWVSLMRWRGRSTRSARGGAVFVLSTVGSIGMLIHWYWSDILIALGRDARMSGRTALWEIVRWFSRQQPWTGWGYEAIWTHPAAIAISRGAFGKNAWAAHNGYYEIVLSVGYLGLIVFVAFLGLAAWRAFRFAWERTSLMSLAPLAFIVFCVVANFSEGTFIANEAIMVLTVAFAVAVTEWPRREASPEPAAVGPAGASGLS